MISTNLNDGAKFSHFGIIFAAQYAMGLAMLVLTACNTTNNYTSSIMLQEDLTKNIPGPDRPFIYPNPAQRQAILQQAIINGNLAASGNLPAPADKNSPLANLTVLGSGNQTDYAGI